MLASHSSTPRTTTRSAQQRGSAAPSRSWAAGSRAGATRSSWPPSATARPGCGAWESGNSRKNIMLSVEASLRRLRTDYLDLYQLHAWDPVTPIDETLGALDDLVKSGKVRYAGCANFRPYQLARTIGRAELLGRARPRVGPVALQPALPRGRAGPVSAVRGRGNRNAALQPAGGRAAGRPPRPRRPTAGSRFTVGSSARCVLGPVLASGHARFCRPAPAARGGRRGKRRDPRDPVGTCAAGGHQRARRSHRARPARRRGAGGG